MTSSVKPLVYLILGAAGSGRREVLRDLLADGLAETDRPAVMISSGDATSDGGSEIIALPNASTWEWRDGTIVGDLPPHATHVFFVTDGAGNPIDQIEVFKAWLEARSAELARVFCVVNTQLAAKHPALLAWYEACVHFADVVLLNKREGVANKWMSSFLEHFEKLYYPCVFEMVRDGRVKNPALILEPQARRMSHVFDEEQDWVFTNSEGEEIDEQEETEDGDDEIEAKPAEDPYFERRNGGRRLMEIPDIAEYLKRE